MKRKLLALLLIFAMVFALAACGSSSSSSSDDNSGSGESVEAPAETEQPAAEVSTDSGEPVYGGSATFYYPKFYNNFDPSAKTQAGYMMWYDYLFMIDWGLNDPSTFDFTSNYYPTQYLSGQLADTWEIADDYSYMDIILHDGVYFQTLDDEYDYYGGRQMTAADVAYSFSRLLGINGVAQVESETDWNNTLYMVENVEALDDLTVHVTFSVKTEIAVNEFIVLAATGGTGIVGEEWDALGADKQADWHYACGTGPYILKEYVSDNYMYFVKNDNYFGVDERYGNQLPYIDEITLVYIAESDNILTQFVSGELDWFGGQKSGLLTTSQVAQLTATMDPSSYAEYHMPSGSPAGIGLKCNYEPFDDINVRIALQHAINCEEIWTEYYGYDISEFKISGLWDDALGYSAEWSDEVTAEYTYDPDLAKDMLAEAGYPDGFEFTIVCDPLTDIDLYTLVQSYFALVGVTMNIEPIAEVMEQNQIATNKDDPRVYNSFAGNFTNFNDVNNYMVEGGFAYGLFYDNTEFPALAADYQSATTTEETETIAKAMDEIFISQHWILTFADAAYCSEFMSGRIGGYTGENIYTDTAGMHTILARIWVTDGQ